MSSRSYHLGHPTIYKEGIWYFNDDGARVDFARTEVLPRIVTPSVEARDHHVCRHCGQPPTPEGYDACLGYIPGAIAACCGHGQEPGYVMYESRVGSRLL